VLNAGESIRIGAKDTQKGAGINSVVALGVARGLATGIGTREGRACRFCQLDIGGIGAGDGNRTRISCLEGKGLTITQRPQRTDS
jgi:hypothetical protein